MWLQWPNTDCPGQTNCYRQNQYYWQCATVPFPSQAPDGTSAPAPAFTDTANLESESLVGEGPAVDSLQVGQTARQDESVSRITPLPVPVTTAVEASSAAPLVVVKDQQIPKGPRLNPANVPMLP